jgi:probable addiction module antidote protein
MPIETTKFDVQDFIKTPEDQAAYLVAVLDDGDQGLIAAALGDIARARGASQFAKETGLSRETIYKSLRPGGNPTLDTITKAVKTLGLKLSLTHAV